MGPWLQFIRTTLDEPVLVNFSTVTRIQPESGLLGKKDFCRLHFGPGESELSICVTESYDEVTSRLHAAIHGGEGTRSDSEA